MTGDTQLARLCERVACFHAAKPQVSMRRLSSAEHMLTRPGLAAP